MTKENSDQEAIAVALVWDGRTTPTVSAKGEELLGQRIIELARQHDIPLYEDAKLARLLSTLELDEAVPPPLYLAVAKVIAFAYFISGRTSVFDPEDG